MSDQPSITHAKCGRTSYHPKDIEHRYCSFCHEFHERARTMATAMPLTRSDIRQGEDGPMTIGRIQARRRQLREDQENLTADERRLKQEREEAALTPEGRMALWRSRASEVEEMADYAIEAERQMKEMRKRAYDAEAKLAAHAPTVDRRASFRSIHRDRAYQPPLAPTPPPPAAPPTATSAPFRRVRPWWKFW